MIKKAKDLTVELKPNSLLSIREFEHNDKTVIEIRRMIYKCASVQDEGTDTESMLWESFVDRIMLTPESFGLYRDAINEFAETYGEE